MVVTWVVDRAFGNSDGRFAGKVVDVRRGSDRYFYTVESKGVLFNADSEMTIEVK